jgi:hypothetical protein
MIKILVAPNKKMGCEWRSEGREHRAEIGRSEEQRAEVGLRPIGAYAPVGDQSSENADKIG